MQLRLQLCSDSTLYSAAALPSAAARFATARPWRLQLLLRLQLRLSSLLQLLLQPCSGTTMHSAAALPSAAAHFASARPWRLQLRLRLRLSSPLQLWLQPCSDTTSHSAAALPPAAASFPSASMRTLRALRRSSNASCATSNFSLAFKSPRPRSPHIMEVGFGQS